MRMLAIETSGRSGSIALAEAGRVLDEHTFPHGLKHAAGLLPLIADACAARGWTPSDLQHLYVSVGPGSFTGLRIGVTLVKTLAFATGANVVAVPSARVLVENAPPEARHAVVVLDAKRDQIFTARFERVDGEWVERQPARIDSLTEAIAGSPRPVYLIGEGLPFHEKFIPPGVGVVTTSPETWRARASVVAKLGWDLAQRGAFADVFTLSPVYIRKPEAEEKADAAEAARMLSKET